MVGDVKVANRLHGDVNARMPRQEIEHMVEEADAGRDVGHACPVEVNANLDVGLLGLALDGRRAHEKVLPVAENAALLTGPSRLRYCGMACSGANFGLW